MTRARPVWHTRAAGTNRMVAADCAKSAAPPIGAHDLAAEAARLGCVRDNPATISRRSRNVDRLSCGHRLSYVVRPIEEERPMPSPFAPPRLAAARLGGAPAGR